MEIMTDNHQHSQHVSNQCVWSGRLIGAINCIKNRGNYIPPWKIPEEIFVLVESALPNLI